MARIARQLSEYRERQYRMQDALMHAMQAAAGKQEGEDQAVMLKQMSRVEKLFGYEPGTFKAMPNPDPEANKATAKKLIADIEKKGETKNA